MMNLKQSIFVLLSLASLGMTAADVHVVKVAVINGKRFELKELPADLAVPEMMKMNKRVKKPHWSGASFHPQASLHKGPEAPKEDRPVSYDSKRMRKNDKCPVRRRFRKAPVFIKVIKVHEKVVVDPYHHFPICKVVRTYHRLYLKAPKKPLKRISSTADKQVIGNKQRMMEFFEKGKQQQASSKVDMANNSNGGRFKDTDKQFIMFLLGMSSTLCLFGIIKALVYLFSPDEQKHHSSYSKVANDENRILLEVEERTQNSPPQTV